MKTKARAAIGRWEKSLLVAGWVASSVTGLCVWCSGMWAGGWVGG